MYRELDQYKRKQWILVPFPVLDQCEHFYTTYQYPLLLVPFPIPSPRPVPVSCVNKPWYGTGPHNPYYFSACQLAKVNFLFRSKGWLDQHVVGLWFCPQPGVVTLRSNLVKIVSSKSIGKSTKVNRWRRGYFFQEMRVLMIEQNNINHAIKRFSFTKRKNSLDIWPFSNCGPRIWK